jgi:hypothetical protein
MPEKRSENLKVLVHARSDFSYRNKRANEREWPRRGGTSRQEAIGTDKDTLQIDSRLPVSLSLFCEQTGHIFIYSKYWRMAANSILSRWRWGLILGDIDKRKTGSGNIARRKRNPIGTKLRWASAEQQWALWPFGDANTCSYCRWSTVTIDRNHFGRGQLVISVSKIFGILIE